MTRKQIADRVAFTLGLQDDTTFSESGYILDLIYEGIQDISARTRPYTRVINLILTANTAVHDMSTQVISLLDLEDGFGFLDRYSREDITNMQKGGVWFAAPQDGFSSMRGFCYEEPLLWISPIPTETATIKAYGVFRPLKMTSDTDTPADPTKGGLADEFHPTIVTYCLWKAGEYMQHEASGNGEKWRIQYEGAQGEAGELAKIKRILTKRATPAGTRRRNMLRSVGSVPDIGYYTGG